MFTPHTPRINVGLIEILHISMQRVKLQPNQSYLLSTTTYLLPPWIASLRVASDVSHLSYQYKLKILVFLATLPPPKPLPAHASSHLHLHRHLEPHPQPKHLLTSYTPAIRQLIQETLRLIRIIYITSGGSFSLLTLVTALRIPVTLVDAMSNQRCSTTVLT